MTRARPSRAFTLIEVMAAVTVLSIIVVVIFPVIHTLISAHADSVSDRRSTERAAFAIDRVVRVVREVLVDSSGEVELGTILAGEMILDDGSGVRLSGTDLLLVDTASGTHVLCEGVTTFTLTYLGEDGTTATSDPALIWRVQITLVADGAELRSAAFIRERIGGA